MSRLIEIPSDVPSSLAVCLGDLLVFDASGGYIRSGTESLELLGISVRSVVGSNGQVLAPLGAPNAVTFIARNPGTAEIALVTGDAWQNPSTILVEIVIS